MNRAEKRRQQKLAEKAAAQAAGAAVTPQSPAPQPLTPQSLELAVQHHSAGRLPEAEHLYQQILQADPDHPVALHLLGLIAHQVGKNEVAVELISKALAIKPDYLEAHSNLGNAYSRLGRTAEAMASYRKALAIKPDYAEAHSNLAAALQGQGQLEDAQSHYRKALSIKPDYIEALNNLGGVLREMGEIDEAVASYRQALSLKPDYANALNGLGLALQDMAKHDEAGQCFEEAIAIKPDFVEALSNLGATLQSLGKLDEAVASCRKVLSIKPAFAEAHNNLGICLKEQGLFDDALASYQTALSIKPDYYQALNNLGSALQELARLDEAVSCYRKALAIRPGYASAHSNLGAALQAQGKLDEAVSSAQKAIAIDPQFAEAHNNLGNALKDLDKLDDAIASYRKAVSIRPDYAESYSNMATAQQGLGQLEEALESCQSAISMKPDFDAAHSNLIFIQNLYPDIDQTEQQAELQRWNEKFIVPLAGKIQAHTNNHDPERRLRIGYVSADFCLHSAYLGFAPLILNHNRNDFDVICYDASVVHDSVSETLQGAATDWRFIRGMSDDDLAATIRDDAIDILVDLSGHTRGNRLKVFGHKPAPLQVSGIGHMAPGITTIDYRLTTDRLTPPDKESLHPEKPIYLNTFFGFTPPPHSPQVGPLPCLENAAITFGYMGRLSRVSDEALALWARILGDLPGARLLLKYGQLDGPEGRQNIKRIFSHLGIAEDRLTLLGKTAQPEHLDTHNRVDMAFDTFPHGGGMTTMDCLWMGVPVIGLVNPERASGRIVDCICSPLGLTGWIAGGTEEYHAIALQWAQRTQELGEIRQGLRGKLCDAYFRFPTDVEKSYRLIWQRWCKGEATGALCPTNDIDTGEQDYADAVEHHRNARWPEAEAAYRKVLATNPDTPSALLNLGAIVLQSGNYDEAITLSRRAITLKPDHAGAHNNLGTALQKLGQLDEAIGSFEKALGLAPDDAALHNNMGNALVEKGQPEEAIRYFEQALALNPDYAEASFNKGNALKDLGKLEEAITCLRYSVSINPRFATAHYNLGRAYADTGQFDQALASYRQAIELEPDYEDAHSNILMTLHYAPSTTGADIFTAATAWARPYNQSVPEPQFQNTADPERRLRIGYVSADFSNHPVGFYLRGILPFHNNDKVEIACYSNSRKSDETTTRLHASASIWRNVSDLSNKAMAVQINEDGIDILVDLSGHTAGHRLPVFALRPAPVQATWMGYTGTTGLTAIDHILADHFVIPEDEQDLYSESVAYLPGCYLCFEPPEYDLATVSPPAKDAGFITFGSFNNRMKITAEAISSWAQILDAVAGSRLFLKTPQFDNATARDSLLDQFSCHGINAERLLLEGRSPRSDMLRAYQRVDIALDTQPFGGGMTTAEALWMGLPVITLRSRRWSGRLGETLLNGLGMPELVADNPQHYYDLAVSLANDLPRLEQLHGQLRDTVIASALCDGAAFAIKLELAYRKMWQGWCTRQDKK